ncbi:MAG: fasciclin domain-containing protein [Bdellovibrionota bacterium]
MASPSATASASASPAAALANCYAAIAAQPQFSNYITAINQAGLQSSLQGTGPFTVFVPTNNAFASVNSIDDDALPELYASNNSNNNGATLVQVLQYGVVPGQYSSAQLAGLSTVNTLEGAGLQLSGGQLINGSNEVPNANIVAADIQANNCTIQGVDQIVFPPGYNL